MERKSFGFSSYTFFKRARQQWKNAFLFVLFLGIFFWKHDTPSKDLWSFILILSFFIFLFVFPWQVWEKNLQILLLFAGRPLSAAPRHASKVKSMRERRVNFFPKKIPKYRKSFTFWGWFMFQGRGIQLILFLSTKIKMENYCT